MGDVAEAADGGESGALGIGATEVGSVAAEDETAAAADERDRCDRDTRLSRASIPKIARPRLRSS